ADSFASSMTRARITSILRITSCLSSFPLPLKTRSRPWLPDRPCTSPSAVVRAHRPFTGLKRLLRLRPSGRLRAERDRQLREPTEHQAFAPAERARWDGEPEVRRAAQQGVDRDLPFEPREGRAQAVVDAQAEGEVAVRVAGEVEAVGILELPLVPVGGGE